jgi:hypothetical protein
VKCASTLPDETLSDEERERLRSLVQTRGLSATAKILRSSRGAVAAALVPLGTRRGTIALIRAGLQSVTAVEPSSAA